MNDCMKISTLEQAMRAFTDGPWEPALESVNASGVLNRPALAEFAEAASTLAQRVDKEGDDPTTPMNWI